MTRTERLITTREAWFVNHQVECLRDGMDAAIVASRDFREWTLDEVWPTTPEFSRVACRPHCYTDFGPGAVL